MRRLIASLGLLLFASMAAAQYEPPAGYYSTATGTGATLKSRLHDIIDNHTIYSYDAARSLLQETDADPTNPGHILLAYDRVSLDVSRIGGSIPGWDSGFSWNREHTWPRSKGVDTTGADNSDLHQLRPTTPTVNSDRGNLNFGGAFGQPYGFVSDGGTKWYPGDADAGMIARQQFYMAVRYDGSDTDTENLELAAGNPFSTLGDLNRLVQWHYAAPPDEFELARNHIVYDYQGNRNPFIDRPEWVWSVFVDQQNDSQLLFSGSSADSTGAATLDLDWGRAYVGAEHLVPGLPSIVKNGVDGTYLQVDTEGLADVYGVAGRYAMRTGSGATVPLAGAQYADTSVAGSFTGSLTVDNLDITTGAGQGRGASDGNDVLHLSFDVVDHPVASFAADMETREQLFDFGSLPQGFGVISGMTGAIVNLAAGGAPLFAADLDLDAIVGTGDTDVFALNLSTFAGLGQGNSVAIQSFLDTTVAGVHEATFELLLSGEDLPGEQTQTLSLTLIAEVVAAGLDGDFNNDGQVDLKDYVVWRNNLGSDFDLGGNGVDDGVVDTIDYAVWKANFGATAGGTLQSQQVPEPRGILIAGLLLALGAVVVRRPIDLAR